MWSRDSVNSISLNKEQGTRKCMKCGRKVRKVYFHMERRFCVEHYWQARRESGGDLWGHKGDVPAEVPMSYDLRLGEVVEGRLLRAGMGRGS